MTTDDEPADGPGSDDADADSGNDRGPAPGDRGTDSDDREATAEDRASGTDERAENGGTEASESDPDDRGGRTDPGSSDSGNDDSSGGFLSNVKNARSQLGDAKEAFSNARGAGNLPTDEEGRVRLVCRRYEERRLTPLDDKGRPTCYEAGHPDCEDCVEAVRDRSVETW